MKLKTIYSRYVLIICVMLVSLVSCESFFEDDNSDPNAPFDVPISAALPAIQLTIVDSYGGLWSNFGNMWVQQIEGVERQWESFNRYDAQPVRFNQSWNQLYENVFVELRVVSAKATEGELNHYLAVAKTLEAFALMMTTDVFGDTPYTEAGLGDANNNPAYDDQATVLYPAIRTLLTDALALFNGPGGSITPGSDDVIYGGNVDNWKLAIHGILARYYLHLGDNANALAEAKLSISARSENMGYSYPGAGNDAPYAGFNDTRQGDLEFHPTMGGIMMGLNDTDRLAVMNPTFDSSHPYLTPNQRVDLVTYRELQFIIAETSTAPAEQYTAFQNGIKASFEELGLGDAEYDTYFAQPAVGAGAGNLTMENIMTQKYIGMFVQAEAWNDWKRTGIPALTAVPESTSNVIPRRFFYPENEYLFNENAPARDSDLLFQKVDWDN